MSASDSVIKKVIGTYTAEESLDDVLGMFRDDVDVDLVQTGGNGPVSLSKLRRDRPLW